MSDFIRRVYSIVRQVPPGKVISYTQVAMMAGRPRAARTVGYAMRCCPFSDVPCHRVLRQDGTLPPAAMFEGTDGQALLLRMENVEISEGRKVDMRRYRWHPEK